MKIISTFARFSRKWALEKFESYSVDLKNLTPGVHEYEYFLENKFFTDIEGDQVHNGRIHASLTIRKLSMMFELNFKLEGFAVIPCDRCLEDMEQPIKTTNRLVVKFGTEYAEEGDDIIIIPETEGKINLAWFFYEFIALAIPLKHIHAPGKCDETMMFKLKEHTARSADNEDGKDNADSNIDPRWAALKNLLVENNNN